MLRCVHLFCYVPCFSRDAGVSAKENIKCPKLAYGDDRRVSQVLNNLIVSALFRVPVKVANTALPGANCCDL